MNSSKVSASPIDFLPLGSDSTNDLKFGLFVKNRELAQISQSLRQVLVMKDSDRLSWFKEHGDLLSQMIDSFLIDSNMALEGMQQGDEEALDLSLELMVHLRDMVNTTSSIARGCSKLNS